MKDRALVAIVAISILLLPTLSYVSFVGFLVVIGVMAFRAPRAMASFWWREGFVLVALGLILSTLLAYDRSVAYVQLANFLPFMGVTAALAVWLGNSSQPFRYLEDWAAWFLVISVPVNLFAVLEYILMAPAVRTTLGTTPGFRLFYEHNYDFGHRADLLFGSPNALACYLGFVFALGLGLLLSHCLVKRCPLGTDLGAKSKVVGWLYKPGGRLGTVTFLNLVGLFCTGSRNGILVTGAIFVISLWSIPQGKGLKRACAWGLGALLLCTIGFGMGGRKLSGAIFTQDPRLGVWRIAWDYALQHPWFGIGLGNYRLLYPPEAVPGYVEMPHAHNLWLMLVSEAGFPVAIALTLIVGWTLYRGVRILPTLPPQHRAIALGYYWAFISLTLFSVFDLTIAYPRTTLLGWFTLGCIYGILRYRSQLGQLNQFGGS
ncbi:O-antigen ligase family protein [Leptolyngbya sp. PCC 6406]|uniref:O-antigen ligase family protein n=1 Tax=Leptolyngbya sp. PCC 6406 TaxID=1173264 RepID=UPI0002ABFB6B|nr:O-antigen ligase family protein [Leptolyngbya sp. PCC 6406]